MHRNFNIKSYNIVILYTEWGGYISHNDRDRSYNCLSKYLR